LRTASGTLNPGTKPLEKPVPPKFIAEYKEATAAAGIDRVWVAKDDGRRLDFILAGIGLEQK